MKDQPSSGCLSVEIVGGTLAPVDMLSPPCMSIKIRADSAKTLGRVSFLVLPLDSLWQLEVATTD